MTVIKPQSVSFARFERRDGICEALEVYLCGADLQTINQSPAAPIERIRARIVIAEPLYQLMRDRKADLWNTKYIIVETESPNDVDLTLRIETALDKDHYHRQIVGRHCHLLHADGAMICKIGHDPKICAPAYVPSAEHPDYAPCIVGGGMMFAHQGRYQLIGESSDFQAEPPALRQVLFHMLNHGGPTLKLLRSPPPRLARPHRRADWISAATEYVLKRVDSR